MTQPVTTPSGKAAVPSPYRVMMYGIVIALLVGVVAFIKSGDSSAILMGAAGAAIMAGVTYYEIKKAKISGLDGSIAGQNRP